MNRFYLVAMGTIVGIAHAAECTPPVALVGKLKAELTYENGLSRNQPYQERFTMATVQDRVFLRRDTVPGTVSTLDERDQLTGFNCPADSTWVDCAAYEAEHANGFPSKISPGDGKPPYPPLTTAVPVCQFVLNIPPWRPSPESADKSRIAAELLKEFQDFPYSDAKSIYIRNFNLEDPDITAMIRTSTGQTEFQGCRFDRTRTPHCSWHLFGQAPLAALRRVVLERRYRLFPPPIGPAPLR